MTFFASQFDVSICQHYLTSWWPLLTLDGIRFRFTIYRCLLFSKRNYLIRKTGSSDTGPESDGPLQDNDSNVILQAGLRILLVRRELCDGDVLGRCAVVGRRDVVLADANVSRGRGDADEAVSGCQDVLSRYQCSSTDDLNSKIENFTISYYSESHLMALL